MCFSSLDWHLPWSPDSFVAPVRAGQLTLPQLLLVHRVLWHHAIPSIAPPIFNLILQLARVGRRTFKCWFGSHQLSCLCRLSDECLASHPHHYQTPLPPTHLHTGGLMTQGGVEMPHESGLALSCTPGCLTWAISVCYRPTATDWRVKSNI